MKFGKKDDMKQFQPQTLKETVHKDLKHNFDDHGKKEKLFLFSGFHKIGKIKKYILKSGQFDIAEYDKKTGMKIVKDGREIKFSHYFIEVKKFIKKVYYIVDSDIVKIDKNAHRMYLPDSLDLRYYGGVWVASQLGVEYIKSISYLRLDQETQMNLENMPGRIMNLEWLTARKGYIMNKENELESKKWQNKKDAEETTFT